MGPLTERAKSTLTAAARLRGEPNARIGLIELVNFENDGQGIGRRPPRRRWAKGYRSHTLPALEKRGLIWRPTPNVLEVTPEGFELALKLTGGYGLL